MIATEAAAEGVNLQFCALIINYDLPWNPQRVEQRIGRCHRYGQRYRRGGHQLSEHAQSGRPARAGTVDARNSTCSPVCSVQVR
jgi:superfamily II DNA/RNA helicase